MEVLLTKDMERSVVFVDLVKYVKVASVALLFYDYFLTLGAEVDLIWRTRWGIGKILFLLARYLAFIAAPMVLYYLFASSLSPSACHSLYAAGTWLLTADIGCAETILIMRTFALSGNDLKVLILLFVVHLAVFIPGIWVVSKFLDSVSYGEPPFKSISGCFITDHSPIVRYGFTAVLAEELIIMLLTLGFGVTKFRHSSNHLVTVLYRDGILYFLYISIVSLANILVLFVGPPELLDLLVIYQPVMHSVISCRIVLHVRKAARFNQSSSFHDRNSEIQFDRPGGESEASSGWNRTTRSLLSPQTWTIEEVAELIAPPVGNRYAGST